MRDHNIPEPTSTGSGEGKASAMHIRGRLIPVWASNGFIFLSPIFLSHMMENLMNPQIENNFTYH